MAEKSRHFSRPARLGPQKTEATFGLRLTKHHNGTKMKYDVDVERHVGGLSLRGPRSYCCTHTYIEKKNRAKI